MQMTERIRILLVKRGNLSEAELARRLGMAPQNLNRKMKRDNFSVTELENIAHAVGCELKVEFCIPDTGELL